MSELSVRMRDLAIAKRQADEAGQPQVMQHLGELGAAGGLAATLCATQAAFATTQGRRLPGTTGVMVNTARYSGDINTAPIFLDPPEELREQVNLVPQMNDTIDMTLHYIGAETCTSDREALREARDLLLAAKPHWASVDYPSSEKFVNEDLNASIFWSGAAGRIREANPGFAYGWPATGYMQWTDNAAILADATNVENARLFLDYIMAPENAALISNYTRYGNAITGSEAFIDPGLLDSPELTIPAELVGAAIDQRLCPPEVQDLYNRIWTEVMR